MLIIGLLFGALQFDSVQTFFAKRLTSYLSDQLKTRVYVDRVSIRFVKSIVLKGLYVEDQHGDTLLFTDELSISINDISTKDKALKISKLTLSGGQFNLKQYHGDVHDNLHFLSEYFGSTDTTTTGEPWKINVHALVIKDFNFIHNIEDDTALIHGVDFSHIDLKHVHGEFSDFATLNDSIFVNIISLSLSDKSGFRLNKFSSESMISSSEIRMKKLVIQTPQTDIHTNLTFRFDSLACFDEFTSRVRWESEFRNSMVSFTDIAYFAPDLIGIDKALKLDGDFRGSVKNFKGKNVTFQWGKKSLFAGNIMMNGLPDIDNTYVEITANEIKTNKNDIEWLPVPPFEEKKHLEVPANLSNLGDVKFKGKFTGFFSDFVAYGNVSTALGSISSDLNLKFNKATKTSDYSGRLAAVKFDVGKIALIPDLGKVSFNADIKGSGLKLNNISAMLEGKITELEFRNYTYRNIAVDGRIAKKLFNGSVNVKDENVDFDFTGEVDYRGTLPEFNFTSNIRSTHLDILNLFRTKDKTVLSTSISSHFSGNRPDNIVGSIDIENTDVLTGMTMFHMNSIKLKADKTRGVRSFDILSDNLDAHFNGEFELAKLGDALKEILPKYLPSVVLPQKSFSSRQNFTYDVKIKNMNVFTELFLPAWNFSPNTTLKGHFNSIEGELALDISTSYIKFKDFGLDNLEVHATANNSQLFLLAKADRLNQNEKEFINLPGIISKAENNKVDFTVKLSDTDSSSNRGHLEGSIDFFSASKFNLKIDSSLIVVENEKWQLDRGNLAVFDSSSISLSNFLFSKSNESILVEGVLGKKQTDKLALKLSGFNLVNLNSLLGGGPETTLGGIVNGDVFFTDPYNTRKLESDLKISNLSFETDTIGNASIICHYDNAENVVVTNISIIKGVSKIVDINGNYYISRMNSNLDFNIMLNNLYLHPLEPYISDIMHEVYGKVSADLKLSGSLKKPVFNGTLSLNKVSLIVNYLNTRYSFSNTVQVKENEISINNLTLVDENNNEGVANGKVYHDYFKKFRLDIELQAKKFQVLNTTAKDNELYYGKANGTGYAHFYGPLESMNMDISMSPDKGSKINIPLNSSSELSSAGFITFIKRSDDSTLAIARNKVDLSGVKLNMDLDMNRNAEIKIIFDEKIGDIISGTGTGSLRLDINSAGNFSMYGTYTIDKGDYLFTLQNLLNKKFLVDAGSKITWSGDPYDAMVDISAVYVVYTSSLYNIVQDSTYKRRIPVDCKLFLTNKLMNPSIAYEIEVKGLDASAESILKTTLNSEQEINRQMLGLLFFGQFFPISGSGQTATRLDAGSGAGANASELLSNQVSNWLGQINKDVVIGVNYRAKDTYTPEEVEVMISKSLFDDRLNIQTNVGFLGEQQNINTNVVGDFYAEYKVSEDGRFRIKGFNRNNVDDIIKYSQSPYTQGVGFFYRKEYDKFADLFARWRKKNKAPEPVAPTPATTP